VSWFYNSFRPLVSKPAGRRAAVAFGLPPFIDGSCRREPDFQSAYPSITGLCRKNKLTPRLHVGDHVIYVTTKGRWGGIDEPHRRLVAVLRVRERFADHPHAAQWYSELKLPLPSNCWVDDNLPIPYAQTVQDTPEATWDRDYRARARRYPTFLATDPLFCKLDDPPIVTTAMLLETFGREPGTQNPPRISDEEAYHLLRLADVML
jgi:hypothetical protein